MIEKPVAIKITSDQHIQETRSLVRELEKTVIIAPFMRFTVCLMDHLKKEQKWNESKPN